MLEVMIKKLEETTERELRYFLDNPENVNLKSIDGAIARCFGALTLATDVLYELGYKDLGDSLGKIWEATHHTFREILYKSWGL